MPYKAIPPDRLLLWPHQSLTPRGFVWFIAATALLTAVPLVGQLGTPILWAVLPFVSGMVWAIWFALRKNGRDRQITEELSLTPDRMHLVRRGPGDRVQDWQANPYWVRVTLHPTGGPVPNYLTLKGEGREVELGAFLSEGERTALAQELGRRLADCRKPARL